MGAGPPPAPRIGLGAAAIAAVCIAGIVVVIAGGGSTWSAAAGWALVGLAGILAVGGAFYLVGRSEDRDRARR